MIGVWWRDVAPPSFWRQACCRGWCEGLPIILKTKLMLNTKWVQSSCHLEYLLPSLNLSCHNSPHPHPPPPRGPAPAPFSRSQGISPSAAELASGDLDSDHEGREHFNHHYHLSLSLWWWWSSPVCPPPALLLDDLEHPGLLVTGVSLTQHRDKWRDTLRHLPVPRAWILLLRC